MKKGISIWSFSGGTLAENFRLAKEAGFDGVEIAIAETGELNVNASEEEVLAIKESAEKAGIELYSVASGLGWNYSLMSNDKEEAETGKKYIAKQLKFASLLGCDTILVVPGSVTEAVPYEIAYQRALEQLKDLAPIAEELQVTIGVENVWNNFLLSPLEMRDFIDAAGSPFIGAYFDVGNVMINGYPQHWIQILGQRIQKVHIKDFRKSIGNIQGFVDLLSGDVNFPEVIAGLKKIGYDGYLTAEIMPVYPYYPKDMLTMIAKEMDIIFNQ